MSDIRTHHRRAFLLALCVVALCGTSVSMRAELPAFEKNEALFPTEVPDGEDVTRVASWAKTYHERVHDIVDEYVGYLQRGGSCGENTAVTPLPLLDALAKDLKIENVSAETMPTILLRYLEVYEQALASQSLASVAIAVGNDKVSTITELDTVITRERAEIGEQLALARPTLHRTLLYLSGYGRFVPLGDAIQCLQEASVDILNNLNLATQASACLPRVWDAKTSLRTLAP
jgi:hypothetical protein